MKKDIINNHKINSASNSSEPIIGNDKKLTFKELKERIAATDKKPLPTYFQLIESGSRIFMKRRIGEDTELTVYENGFALYEKQTCEDEVTATVFGVDRLGEVAYDSATPMKDLKPEDFEDEDCMLRLVMEGEERIAHNRDKVQSDNIAFSLSGDGSDWSVHEEPSYTDGEDDDEQEKIRKLYEGLKNLTDRQRQVVLMYVVQGMTQQEIADKLGVSQRAVGYHLEAGMNKLKKFFRKI